MRLAVYNPLLRSYRGGLWLAEQLLVGRLPLVVPGMLAAADLHKCGQVDVTSHALLYHYW